MASLRFVAVLCTISIAAAQPNVRLLSSPSPSPMMRDLAPSPSTPPPVFAPAAPAPVVYAPTPAPIVYAPPAVPAPVPAPVPVPLPAPVPSSVAGPLPSASDLKSAVSPEDIKGDVQKIKMEGQAVYHKVADEVKADAMKIRNAGQQVYNKIDALPADQKIGVAVGSAVGVAAVAAGAIAGGAVAAQKKHEETHEAHMEEQAQEAKAEAREKQQALQARIAESDEPRVVKVMVPVQVPVKQARSFWPRLYQDDGQPAQFSIAAIVACVFIGCVLIGISGFVYLKSCQKRRVESRAFSREHGESEDDDDEPLLA